MYKIYTDGSCSKNGTKNAIGSAAYIIINDDNNIIIKGVKSKVGTTNQEMELLAPFLALNELKCNNLLKDDTQVVIYSDSAYLINCYKQKWYKNWELNGWRNAKKEPVANKMYWQFLIPYFKDNRFSFQKVKGHCDDYYNNYVDKMAQDCTKKQQQNLLFDKNIIL